MPIFQVLGDTSANRVIAAKLVHEEPQKPSDLPEELRQSASTHEPPMSKEDKHVGSAELNRAVNACGGFVAHHRGAVVQFCVMHVASSCCTLWQCQLDYLAVRVHSMSVFWAGAGSAL